MKRCVYYLLLSSVTPAAQLSLSFTYSFSLHPLTLCCCTPLESDIRDATAVAAAAAAELRLCHALPYTLDTVVKQEILYGISLPLSLQHMFIGIN